MRQTAVFVDAGYLYAQGSALLTGAVQSRSVTQLDVERAIDLLTIAAERCEPGNRLLRIYWYDAVRRDTAMSPEQRRIADSDNVKFRVGAVNYAGKQKGVDSLILLDLVELARNHVIADALLLSGDEDLRIGVALAQQYGVRIHLIGIAPRRETQSPELLAEADTSTEWDGATCARLLHIDRAAERVDDGPLSERDFETLVAPVVEEALQDLSRQDVFDIVAYADSSNGALPPLFYGPVLRGTGLLLNRQVRAEERLQLRILLSNAVRALLRSFGAGDGGHDDVDDHDDDNDAVMTPDPE